MEAAHWSAMLRVPRAATTQEIKSAFRNLAHEHHPDHGGADPTMAIVNRAYQQALQERA